MGRRQLPLDWNARVEQMLTSGELNVRMQRADTLIVGRTLEQLDQDYNGVRIWGGILAGNSMISERRSQYLGCCIRTSQSTLLRCSQKRMPSAVSKKSVKRSLGVTASQNLSSSLAT